MNVTITEVGAAIATMGRGLFGGPGEAGTSVGTTVWSVVVTGIRLDVPDSSTTEEVTTVVVTVTKDVVDVPPVEAARKAGRGELVSTWSKLPGLKVLEESTEAIAPGVLVGTVAGMVVVVDPGEGTEGRGSGEVETSPSIGDVSEGVAVVSVVFVLLLRISATEGLATVTVGGIDVESVASLVETNRSTGTPGVVVGDSTEFPSVVVTPSAEELVGVGALSGSDVGVVAAVMFKIAVVCIWPVVAAKRTPDAGIAELVAPSTSVGPPTPLVPTAFPPGNSEALCTEETFGMCDGPSFISLPVLVATGEMGGEMSVDVLVTVGRLAPLGDSVSSEGSGVRVSCVS